LLNIFFFGSLVFSEKIMDNYFKESIRTITLAQRDFFVLCFVFDKIGVIVFLVKMYVVVLLSLVNDISFCNLFYSFKGA